MSPPHSLLQNAGELRGQLLKNDIENVFLIHSLRLVLLSSRHQQKTKVQVCTGHRQQAKVVDKHSTRVLQNPLQKPLSGRQEKNKHLLSYRFKIYHYMFTVNKECEHNLHCVGSLFVYIRRFSVDIQYISGFVVCY